MNPIIKCIEDIAKEKNISMEKMILELLQKKILNIPNNGLLGIPVYPTINEPIKTINGDVYVPGLVDKFMLAFDYTDKKTKKIPEITPRTSDYQYSSGIPKAPIGWYMSEKFDGQRALWDGSKFVTRGSKNSLPRVYPYVPIWFIALMPPGIALDGEFFIKRNSFQEIGFLKSKLKKESDRCKKDNTILDLDKKWINIKYQVFDIPSDNSLFEERMELLKNIVMERCILWNLIPLPPYLKKEECPIIFTEQYLIKSEKSLDEYYSRIVSQDAEGVMIRAPRIPYIPNRTRLILKLKPEDDAECMIVGYKPGTGKYSNLLGAFECIQENKKFYISGMNDSIRKDYLKTHPLGTIITYKYTSLTDDGIPRFPRYYRIFKE